jgi:murein DD-endopeptidase MepM/ murein hydrolase activator NlpD
VVGAVVLVLAVAAAVPAGGQVTPGLEETRERAARTTQELADAEARLGLLDRDIAAAEHRAVETRAEVDALTDELRQAAVARFVRAGTTPSMFQSADLMRHLRGTRLGVVATEGAGDVLERYGAVWEDLQVAEAELRAKRSEQDTVLAELRARRQQLDADLARLEELERQRLEEERRRLEAERRQREEAERQRELERQRQAEAEREAAQRPVATTAPPAPTGGTPAPTGGTPAPTGGAGTPTGGAGTPTGGTASPPPGPTTRPPTAASPAPTAAPPTTAGPPPTPAPPAPPANRGRLAVCPVAGPHFFVDTWGAPRSGGRRHRGVDMMAATGVPVVAPVSGVVSHRSNSVGGRSFYLAGDDGNTYFGTHLSGYGTSGRVSAGEVIGYVGDDGNARGNPHLHFEVWPGGGSPVNPYPWVAAVCR